MNSTEDHTSRTSSAGDTSSLSAMLEAWQAWNSRESFRRSVDTARLRVRATEAQQEQRREQLNRWHSDDTTTDTAHAAVLDADARSDGRTDGVGGPGWIVCDDGPGLP